MANENQQDNPQLPSRRDFLRIVLMWLGGILAGYILTRKGNEPLPTPNNAPEFDHHLGKFTSAEDLLGKGYKRTDLEYGKSEGRYLILDEESHEVVKAEISQLESADGKKRIVAVKIETHPAPATEMWETNVTFAAGKDNYDDGLRFIKGQAHDRLWQQAGGEFFIPQKAFYDGVHVWPDVESHNNIARTFTENNLPDPIQINSHCDRGTGEGPDRFISGHIQIITVETLKDRVQEGKQLAAKYAEEFGQEAADKKFKFNPVDTAVARKYGVALAQEIYK